jgi:hypothetical protein
MNEPKKRGRPPKALWKGETQESASPDVSGAVVHIISDLQPPSAEDVGKVNEFARRAAQNYANRIWAGQSRDLSRHERLGRIKAALEAQGMSMEGVEL